MADEDNTLDLLTQLIQGSRETEWPAGQPTSTPIYAAATYTYESMGQMDKVFGGELPGYVYTRHGNPTVNVLEEVMCRIEQGATACAYGSGMAALHAALFACE